MTCNNCSLDNFFSRDCLFYGVQCPILVSETANIVIIRTLLNVYNVLGPI